MYMLILIGADGVVFIGFPVVFTKMCLLRRAVWLLKGFLLQALARFYCRVCLEVVVSFPQGSLSGLRVTSILRLHSHVCDYSYHN